VLTNNFVWNRQGTFRAADGHIGVRASRVALISTAAFFFSPSVFHVLIDVAGVAAVAAQALAVQAALPHHYVAHRIWSVRS
jgi:putative flippase GtrA